MDNLRPPDTDPPWLEAFGKMTGIEDKAELHRLHSLAKLFQSTREGKAAKGRPLSQQKRNQKNLEMDAQEKPWMNIHEAYEAQKDHMSMIACSLGACPECWGHDADCTQCAGQGRPGAFLPDERCFERFVLPAVERILRDSKSPALDSRGTHITERHSAKLRS